jgi:hypothetical protein
LLCWTAGSSENEEVAVRKGAIRTLCLALLVGTIGLMGADCDDEGPIEKAGEKVDEGLEEAGDEIEDAVD